MNFSKQIALIGPTASGKTALAIELATQYGGIVLSLDSLAVYRTIDIASAKPTSSERKNIPHFGIDLLDPDRSFDVVMFLDEYRRAYAEASRNHTPLILVGGSGFYLKTLLDGISPMPKFSDDVLSQVADHMGDLSQAYQSLRLIDPLFADRIKPTDRYRVEKALLIYYASGKPPHLWFKEHPPVPIITDPLPIYEITVDRAMLRERIALRTSRMLRDGLIDETARLERRYGRSPNAMKSIGIKESLDYLDGRYTRSQLRDAIITHTAQLAKRQVTFNKSQFAKTIRGSLQILRQKLLR